MKNKHTKTKAWNVLLHEAKLPVRDIEIDGVTIEVGKGLICTTYKALSISFNWSVLDTQKYILSLKRKSLIDTTLMQDGKHIIIEIKEVLGDRKYPSYNVSDNNPVLEIKKNERIKRKPKKEYCVADPCFKCGRYKFKRISKCSDIHYMEWYYANVKNMDERTKAALEIRIDELEYNIYFK